MGEGARRPALRVPSLEGEFRRIVPAAMKGTTSSYTGLYRQRVSLYTRGMLRHLSHVPQIHPPQQERSWSLLSRSTSEHKSADMPSSVPTWGLVYGCRTGQGGGAYPSRRSGTRERRKPRGAEERREP